MKPMSFDEMAAKYCGRQESTPSQLRANLINRIEQYKPDGFMLLECQMMDSRSLGNLVILPYGPNNTYRTIPTHPVSPRGLASDMSVVVGWMHADEVEKYTLTLP
jgi:hypothetical protein